MAFSTNKDLKEHTSLACYMLADTKRVLPLGVGVDRRLPRLDWALEEQILSQFRVVRP